MDADAPTGNSGPGRGQGSARAAADLRPRAGYAPAKRSRRSNPDTDTNRSRPLKVVQLVTTLARGGAQLTVLESTVADPAVIEMTVLAGGDRSSEGDFWDDDRLDRVELVEVSVLKRRIAPLNDIAAFTWLISWLRQEDPDVLHTHSAKAGVLGRLAARVTGTPVVHTVHGWGGGLRAGSRPTRFLVRTLERALARVSSSLVVVGDGDRQFGLSQSIGRAEQYRVVRSGIELPESNSSAADLAREAMGVHDTSFVVGMVARYVYGKKHEDALAAFAPLAEEFENAVMVFVGDGPRRGEVERKIEALGLEGRVIVLGHHPDAAALAAGFDVSLLTTMWEGVPRSLVEAAAHGVPMVVSDVGSVADIAVDTITGFLIPAGDDDAGYQRLRQLYLEPDLRQRMGVEAKSQAELFSVEQMRADLADVWFDVARSSVPN